MTAAHAARGTSRAEERLGGPVCLRVKQWSVVLAGGRCRAVGEACGSPGEGRGDGSGKGGKGEGEGEGGGAEGGGGGGEGRGEGSGDHCREGGE